MKYLSVCSGIEAATVAWHPIGWEPLAFSEIEPFPRKVLTHHYPDVPLHGDFTLLRDQQWIKDADILVGGTPCQAFSVAGLRQSLDDDRGNLTLEFVRLADAIDDLRPTGNGTIIVWENVPGVLSVSDNAFGCFLAALVGNDSPLVPTGGKWTNAGMVVGPRRSAVWRVLDAQYFGVAQRRRRVFVIASARDRFDPAEVLFERGGMRRDSPPRRTAGKDVAGPITAGISKGLRGTEGIESNWAVTTYSTPAIGHVIQDDIASTVTKNTGAGGETQNPAYVTQPIAIDYEFNAHDLSEPTGPLLKGSPSGGGHPLPAVMQALAVRRLTPRECERLQGFPDDYTAIPGAADGPRYKACGNSMAVPVMAWIGKRIFEKMKKSG